MVNTQIYKKIFQVTLLTIGIISFLMMIVLFFYTQNNARVLYRFKKHGVKVTGSVVAKQQHRIFSIYTSYLVTVEYKKKDQQQQMVVSRFISPKVYNNIQKNGVIKILYNPKNMEAILLASTDKKNLRLTDKKTIVYILLILGCVCFVMHSMLGNIKL
ncbi:hypothetical protein [Candidatus Uabimicrobium sp. HlEnr_7]|uniref:hypothetical protein n=1 Tax=Candidatus Uabimicrobium helgolandensis TaxID=3095367 RepID=UPI003557845F